MGSRGLEPPTSGLWARRATNCSTPLYKTTASKPSNNCLTPLLFSDFSHHANHLLIALYGKKHGYTLYGIKWHCLIFASQPLLTGSEHRAACGRWSGALSRKKQGALRAPQASKATMFLTEKVVGSSPTGGARKKHLQMQVLFQLSAPSVHEKWSRFANGVRSNRIKNKRCVYFMRA